MPVRYAELRCRTNFSFLRGASHPEALAARAAELGLSALAVTDVNGIYGMVRAHAEAKRQGIPLVVGAEVACRGLVPGRAAPLVLLAIDREGYGNLCRILSEAHCDGPPERAGGPPRRREEVTAPFELVAGRARGLHALYPGADGEAAARLRDAFGRRAALAIARHHVAGEEARIAAARAVARRIGLAVAVTNDVHTADRRAQPLQDVLTCVRLGTTVERAGRALFPNAERALKGPEEMARLWSDFPEGLEAAAEIADACRFRLDEIRGEHPLPPIVATATATSSPQQAAGSGRALFAPRTDASAGRSEVPPAAPKSGIDLLRDLVHAGARDRWQGEPPDDVRRQIGRELELVERLGYASYFLTVWDIVRFARTRGILCQGRGSAANSVLCYALGITSIDPVRMDFLFERFISVERGEPPDIDVDFEHERREEVIQYVYERYGRDHAGMVCEVVSYRARSAIRDVGKALGLSLGQVDRLAKLVGAYDALDDVTPAVLAAAGLDGEAPALRRTLALGRALLGFPRHLSVHVGGFLITRRPLCETAVVEPAAMEGRTVVQWDKDDVADLGLLKVDLLGLGMLSALSRSLKLLAAHRPAPARPATLAHPGSLATIPAEEPAVYEMCSRADTIGVFQIESRAQMSLLPRLAPRRFYDLVISVAIIRPGPIQGGMIHPFLRRRDGLEPVRFPFEPLRPVLEKTLGVPLFQEQAMRLAVVAAGFSPGEADELRRDITHKRSHERMAALRGRLLAGMAERGIAQADAEAIHQQLLAFAGYGFPESHAASFALLVYASAWVKCHHPAVFAAALLDAQPMGFYAPHTIVEDAKRHGVEVRGLDVQHSGWESALEGPLPGVRAGEGEVPALRVGLSAIRGLPREVGERVVAARAAGGPYASVGDLTRRAALSRAWLARLAEGGALRSLAAERHDAVWRALAVVPGSDGGDLFAGSAPEEPPAAIPAASASEEVAADFANTGLSDRAHPMAMLRPRLAARHVRTARELSRLRDRAPVEVAGLVIVRQRPETASGIVFVSLEDETGIANLVVMPDVYERFRPLVRGSSFLVARGRIERSGPVVNVRVAEVRPLPLDQPIPSVSRDFH